MRIEHRDVIIVGAGLSGIGAACHLEDHCPGKTYTLLEGRDANGATWDLFRYPGSRSDSDMHTPGFSFKPWKERKSIADRTSNPNNLNQFKFNLHPPQIILDTSNLQQKSKTKK